MKIKSLIAGLMVIGSLIMVGCESAESEEIKEPSKAETNAIECAKADAEEFNDTIISIAVIDRLEDLTNEYDVFSTMDYINEITKHINFDDIPEEEEVDVLNRQWDERNLLIKATESLNQEFEKYGCNVILKPVHGVDHIYEGTIYNKETGEQVGIVNQFDTLTKEYNYLFY